MINSESRKVTYSNSPSGTTVRSVELHLNIPKVKWDDDFQKTSPYVKKQLIRKFFSQNKKVKGEIIYITSESKKMELKKKSLIKIRLKEISGTSVIISCPINYLEKFKYNNF